MADIIKSAFGLLEQSIDIFPHALRLLADVANVQDVSFVVNACRSRDEDLATVTIVNACAPFKTDAIFIGGVQMSWRVKMLHLFIVVNAHDCIVVELHQCFGVGVAAADARARNEMCLWCEVLRVEFLVAC